MVNIAQWKKILVLVLGILGFAFSAPNLLSQDTLNKIPDWLPHKHMNLGLDLRGGAHLLIEAKLEVAIKEGLENLLFSARSSLRTNPRINYQNLRVVDNGIALSIPKDEQLSDARSRLRALGQLGMTLDSDGNKLTLSFTSELLRDRKTAALTQAMEVIRRRIDGSGLVEASVQRQGEDRILVQVPGIGDTSNLKSVLGQTAKMTFHLMNPEFQTLNARQRTRPGVVVLPSIDNEKNPAGQQIYYFPDGNIYSSGLYKDDLKFGEWIYYKNEGIKDTIINYNE